MKKVVSLLGTGGSNEVEDYYPTILAQEAKEINKQNNLLTLTISCEKSCLFRRKKNEWINNNDDDDNNNNNNNTNNNNNNNNNNKVDCSYILAAGIYFKWRMEAP